MQQSCLLNNLFYHHLLESGVDADHIIRIAFDSADDLYLIGESLIQIEKEKRGVDPEKFMAYIRSKVAGEGMYYLLLDEIQILDCFEAVLNGYLRKDNMDVFVTGSNAKLLSKDIATDYNGDKYMGLSEYMLYGGIPLVVLREGANDKAAALQNLFNEIYLRDITKRNRVKNIGELEDLLKLLSMTQDFGTVLRAKGIVQTEEGGWLEFDMVPEETEIRDCKPDYIGRICVIGTELKKDELEKVFAK